MAMTVDAMELLYNDRPDAFGIVSSDADFTPLVMHLRAKGTAVFGFGMAQTPKPFVNACSRFLYLEALGSTEPDAEATALAAGASEPAAALGRDGGDAAAPGVPGRPAPARLRVPSAELRQDSRLMTLLRDATQAVQDETGWALVGAVGSQIGNKASFDSRNYGYATLTKLLTATEAFEMRDEGSSRVAVRDKRLTRGGPPR
jgi:uncharacterized LabA/DUF88 family protein